MREKNPKHARIDDCVKLQAAKDISTAGNTAMLMWIFTVSNVSQGYR